VIRVIGSARTVDIELVDTFGRDGRAHGFSGALRCAEVG
jgi:hypothetical protein